jgi:hypothetical protein
MRRLLLPALALGLLFSLPHAEAASPGARATWKQVRVAKPCRQRARAPRRCMRWRVAASLPGWPGPLPEGPSQPSKPEELGHSLQVRAREYSLTLSRTAVASGELHVEFNTMAAEDPHDLWLRDALGAEQVLFGETAPELVPPPRQVFSLAAGEYVLFCSVSGHEALGMRAAVSVR